MWCSRLVVVSVLLIALAGLPAAQAAPATLDVTGTLPLRAAGEARWETHQDPVLLFQSSGGEVAWTLRADTLRLVEVEHWQEVTSGPVSGHSGLRTTEHTLRDVHVRLGERLEGFTLLAWSEGGAARADVSGEATGRPQDPSWLAAPDLRVFSLSRDLTVTAPVDEDAVEDDLRGTIFGRPVPFSYAVPEGALHLQAADAVHALAGPVSGYVSGASVGVRHGGGGLTAVATETVETRPGSVYVPDQGWTGPGSHQERVVRYLQFEAPEAVLRFTTSGVPAALFTTTADLALDGHLAVSEASGTVTFDEGPHEVAAERLVVSGAVRSTVAPGAEPGTARLTGTGDVTYVRMGDEQASFPVGKVAAAAAGLTLLAALGVTLWQQGGLALGLFSRVQKGEVLDHETRAQIYEAVKAEPGVSPHDLVDRTSVGWSTVMYHLNVLERNELIMAIRDGRYRRYFDRTSGRFANGRKKVVAALKNDTSCAIAQHIRDHPGAVQRRLAERFGLAASSIHWHVKRLIDAGLVVKERRAQVVELNPGPAWDKLEKEDLERVLAADRPTVA